MLPAGSVVSSVPELPVTQDAKDLLEHYPPVIRPTLGILDLIADETRPFVAVLHVNC